MHSFGMCLGDGQGIFVTSQVVLVALHVLACDIKNGILHEENDCFIRGPCANQNRGFGHKHLRERRSGGIKQFTHVALTATKTIPNFHEEIGRMYVTIPKRLVHGIVCPHSNPIILLIFPHFFFGGHADVGTVYEFMFNSTTRSMFEHVQYSNCRH